MGGEATSCQGVIVQSFLCSSTAALPSEASFEGSGARVTLLPFPQPAHQAGHPQDRVWTLRLPGHAESGEVWEMGTQAQSLQTCGPRPSLLAFLATPM